MLRSAAQLANPEVMKSNIENLWNYNRMVMRSNLRHFDVVRSVMEAGSVTEAARLLRVSQPAVSKTLAQVEDRLGFRLFTRDRGRLIATAEARALLPEIEKAFLAVDGDGRRVPRRDQHETEIDAPVGDEIDHLGVRDRLHDHRRARTSEAEGGDNSG